MAHEIRVPRLGWSMEEGTFIAWLKADGEHVNAGDPLFELEGEKSLQQVESLDAGILRIPPDAPGSGETVAVGALLAYLASADEPAPWKTSHPAEAAAAPGVAAINSPRAGGDDAGAEPSERCAPRTAERDGRILSSPRARRIASELGIDWTSLRGTGSGGRIREADVRRAAERGAGAAASRAHSITALEQSSRRKVIAERMRSSQRQNAPVTLTMRADASNLVRLRRRFKSDGAQTLVPSYTDIVVGLVARVLPRHRLLAARWDARRERLLLPGDSEFHIGIAVHTDDGLVVPVLRDADLLTLTDIAARTRELVERARAGRLSAAEMQGSVFTVTNLGSYGVEAFTPIINDPETAILGLGAIRREAIVLEDGRIGIGEVMTLSLTFDHGRVDGAPAARFLEDVRRALETGSPA